MLALALIALLLLGCAAPSPPPANFSFPLFQSANLSEGGTLMVGDVLLRAVRINATPSLSPDNRTCTAVGGSMLLQATAPGLGPADLQLAEGQSASFGRALLTLRRVMLDAVPERVGNCSLSAQSAVFNVTARFPRNASLGEGVALSLDGGSVAVLSIRKTVGLAAPVMTKTTLAAGSSYSVSNGSYRIYLPPQNISHALAVSLSRSTLREGDSVSVGSESIKVTGFDITLTTPLYPSWSCNVLDEEVALSIRSPYGTSEVTLREKQAYVSPEGAFIYVNKISETVNPDQRGCTTTGESVELIYSSTAPCSHTSERATLEVTPFGRMTTTYPVEKGQWLELGPGHALHVVDLDQVFYLNHSTGACISSPRSISLEITAPASACPVSEKSVLLQLATPLERRAQVLAEGQSLSLGPLSALVREIRVETSPPTLGSCTVTNISAHLELSAPRTSTLTLSAGSSVSISPDFSLEFVVANATLALRDGECVVSAPFAVVRTNFSGTLKEARLAEGEALPLAEGVSVRLLSLNYSASLPEPACTVRGKTALLDIMYS
ncbi:MAG: hypothetical protein QXG98_04825 [Candidatus Micrarchaeia archaeon]